MVSFHTSYERDPVLFCQFRRNPEDVEQEVAESRQLELLEKVDIDTCVSNADFVPVLKWIWCHSNTRIPLYWLRIMHNEGHALLYYERAIVEFQVCPTRETLHEVCIPLIKQANFLVMQECVRLKGFNEFKKHLMKTVIEDIETSYMGCLENLSLLSLGKSIDDVGDDLKERRHQKIVAAVREVATRSLERAPVKISWLRWYGREKDCGDEERPMSSNSHDLAKKCAESVLNLLDEKQ